MRKCRRNCRRTKPHKAVPDNESDRPSKLGNDAEAIERAKRCFKGPCPLGGVACCRKVALTLDTGRALDFRQNRWRWYLLNGPGRACDYRSEPVE